VSSLFCDKVKYYNSNYGKEVTARLKELEDDISYCSSKEEVEVLLTDINITAEECEYIDGVVNRLKFLGHNITLTLLDHHITGKPQSDKYSWYNLDDKKCATLLTYEYFTKRFPKQKLPSELKAYVSAVNAFDLWKSDADDFEFGKVLNRLVVESKEISKMLFVNEHVFYKHELLKASFPFLQEMDYIGLDDQIIALKKSFLKTDKHDTIDNLIAQYITKLLSDNKERMTIHYGEYKGILTFQVGNTSVLGNSFLQANPDYHFFMDTAPTGNVGLRANNACNVSQMAQHIFDGGGHVNAAGGRMSHLRNIFTYRQIQENVQKFIDKSMK
jgi:oligoribonuclease NrnB/cAMP/cGMP phosphodiesterase (DHH superfamily)